MDNVPVLTSEGWRDYELMDSGEGVKLERWGQYLTVRPDPRIIWGKTLSPSDWEKASAVFVQQSEEKNEWKFKTPPPTPWRISYKDMKLSLKPTDFRHVGAFPEQAANWDWISENISSFTKKNNYSPSVLNLFAYTGAATVIAALSGAKVTHVDSSRPSMMWASENAKLSGIPKDKIRWIQDDATKFARREIRRGVKYDAIIMDPPRFGRGAQGEVWKLIPNLPELVSLCSQNLTDHPLFMLINAYTADISSIALGRMLSDNLKKRNGSTECGEIGIKESASKRILPAGLYARWISSGY